MDTCYDESALLKGTQVDTQMLTCIPFLASNSERKGSECLELSNGRNLKKKGYLRKKNLEGKSQSTTVIFT